MQNRRSATIASAKRRTMIDIGVLVIVIGCTFRYFRLAQRITRYYISTRYGSQYQNVDG